MSSRQYRSIIFYCLRKWKILVYRVRAACCHGQFVWNFECGHFSFFLPTLNPLSTHSEPSSGKRPEETHFSWAHAGARCRRILVTVLQRILVEWVIIKIRPMAVGLVAILHLFVSCFSYCIISYNCFRTIGDNAYT